jgi:light-regulated signal transduction histidine kinase (bacteriophytochrome)
LLFFIGEFNARTIELKAANEKLRKSNEELEQFTYLASHDLKEPLRNISSFVTLIQRRIKKINIPELNEYFDFVILNTKRMYSLVEDVLVLSRINNHEPLASSPVDLNDVIQDVQMGLDTLIREKKAHITTDHLPTVEAPRAHLFLVFKNLIENGIKYNESVKPQVHIYYSIHQEKNCYQFTVSDNGIGVDIKYQTQIFEMFKRLNNREKYTGSGMGLAICKKILARYGGEIWIQSEENKGSTFYFTLPVTSAVNSNSLHKV